MSGKGQSDGRFHRSLTNLPALDRLFGSSQSVGSNQVVGSSTSSPPSPGRSAWGTRTLPSACWWFFRMATQPAGGRQGAVQGGDLRLAVLVPIADAQPPGLEGGAVGGRRQLSVGLLGRHPRLAVELAGGRGTKVAGRHINDAVRDLDGVEHLPLVAEQPLVLTTAASDDAHPTRHPLPGEDR